jgi:hypothetical protein
MMHLTTVVTKFNTLHKPQNVTAEKHSTTVNINTPGPQYEIISSSKTTMSELKQKCSWFFYTTDLMTNMLVITAKNFQQSTRISR